MSGETRRDFWRTSSSPLRSEWAVFFSFFFVLIRWICCRYRSFEQEEKIIARAKQHFSPINFNDVFILSLFRNYFSLTPSFPVQQPNSLAATTSPSPSSHNESDFHETLIGISAGADFVKWILKSLLSFQHYSASLVTPNMFFSNFILHVGCIWIGLGGSLMEWEFVSGKWKKKSNEK